MGAVRLGAVTWSQNSDRVAPPATRSDVGGSPPPAAVSASTAARDPRHTCGDLGELRRDHAPSGPSGRGDDYRIYRFAERAPDMCAPVVESEAKERAACERVGHRRARALHAIASLTVILRRHQPIISSLLNGNYAPETSRARAGPRRRPRSPPPPRRARRIWAENSPRRAGAPTEAPRRSKIGRPDAGSARVIRPSSSRN